MAGMWHGWVSLGHCLRGVSPCGVLHAPCAASLVVSEPFISGPPSTHQANSWLHPQPGECPPILSDRRRRRPWYFGARVSKHSGILLPTVAAALRSIPTLARLLHGPPGMAQSAALRCIPSGPELGRGPLGRGQQHPMQSCAWL